ncbi:hypothetical protein SAMN02799624_04998 [Paenibacillus sp. UNC496MF]|nr:hypothetical protein SAMN02799624_04998 [Paenibacillus sp. UNC496MF]
MRIDAHQHYWKIHRGDYGWITPDNRMMYRDYYRRISILAWNSINLMVPSSFKQPRRLRKRHFYCCLPNGKKLSKALSAGLTFNL